MVSNKSNHLEHFLGAAQPRSTIAKSIVSTTQKKGQFHDLRLRNKQCLDLIKIIKKEITGRAQDLKS